MQNLFTNWSFMRILRLALGIIILVQGIQAKEFMYAFAGLLISGMALANIGCCGVGGCGLPAQKTKTDLPAKEIVYEEIH